MPYVTSTLLCSLIGEDYIQNTTMIVVPAQIPGMSYTFELELDIIDDDIDEMTETFTVSLELLTQVGVSNASNLTASVTIMDDDGKICMHVVARCI